MKENCFDEGTMQAFIDGELSSDLLENVARHVAICDECSLLLQSAEDESAFAFAALDNEFNSLVPTERIRTNLYQAIAEIREPKISWWQKLVSGISLNNPSMVAFASLLIIVGIFAAVLSLQNQPTVNQPKIIATNESPKVETPVFQPTPVNVPTNDVAVIDKVKNSIKSRVKSQESRVESQESRVKSRESRVESQESRVENRESKVENPKSVVIPVVENELLDGEKTYVKTIATLENTVKDKKDNVLRVSSRISFERDMAVVEDSIRRMKAEVRKNPKNDAAKQILRNSYQNKIDLLNSVTERSEFMASLD